MEEQTRYDIRMLLKSFGIQADQAITSHMAKLPAEKVVKLRITLEDQTEYDDIELRGSLRIVLEGEVRG